MNLSFSTFKYIEKVSILLSQFRHDQLQSILIVSQIEKTYQRCILSNCPGQRILLLFDPFSIIYYPSKRERNMSIRVQ